MHDSYVHCCFWWLFHFWSNCCLEIKRTKLTKSLKDPLRPIYVHYFSNKKAWMDLTVKCAQKSARLSYFKTMLPAILKPCRQAWKTSTLLFYLKMQHHDCKNFTLSSLGVLNKNTENCFLANSLIVSLKGKWLP